MSGVVIVEGLVGTCLRIGGVCWALCRECEDEADAPEGDAAPAPLPGRNQPQLRLVQEGLSHGAHRRESRGGAG